MDECVQVKVDTVLTTKMTSLHGPFAKHRPSAAAANVCIQLRQLVLLFSFFSHPLALRTVLPCLHRTQYTGLCGWLMSCHALRGCHTPSPCEAIRAGMARSRENSNFIYRSMIASGMVT